MQVPALTTAKILYRAGRNSGAGSQGIHPGLEAEGKVHENHYFANADQVDGGAV